MPQANVDNAVSSELDSIRSRTLLHAGYLLGAVTVALLLVGVSAYGSLIQSLLAVWDRIRNALGIVHALNAPDWGAIAVIAWAVLLPVVLVVIGYSAYVRSWRRRLNAVWGGKRADSEAILPLKRIAGPGEIDTRSEYLTALLATGTWSHLRVASPAPDAASYRATAETVLAELEKDIAQRAITLGFVVGINHIGPLDLLAIGTAALELQIHVLTRLGKRPSPRMWLRLWRSAGSSLFLNWYLNAEQSLWFRLMIRKIGLGLEAGSEMLGQAGHALTADDVDWDDVPHLLPEHILGIPVQTALNASTMAMGTLVTVGSFGMRQIGIVVEKAGDSLFQGAVAATILYLHGVELAADCLALDREHRDTAALRPGIADVMTRMCAYAGGLLRQQVRNTRAVLRERRTQLIRAAGQKAAGLGNRASASARGMVQQVAGGLFAASVPCPGCGKKLRPSARACRSCGTVLTQQP